MSCNTVVILSPVSGYLTIDIANAFAKKYERVVFMTGYIRQAKRQLDSNIEIQQIYGYKRRSITDRIISSLISTLQMLWYVIAKYRNCEIIFNTTPPISYFLCLLLKNKFSIIAYDIYPDVLKKTRTPKWIINLWTKINKKVFAKANCIFTLSNGMAELLHQYVNKNKITIIPIWCEDAHPEIILESDNRLLQKYLLQNKFIITYSGNIGFTHNVETIVELAKELKYDKSVAFLIIGEGGKKKRLQEYAQANDLTNVLFLDYVPLEELKYSLSATSIGVVTLTADAASVSVPSKTYNLLSYGVPIFCIAPKNSELNNLIKKYDCGRCFEPNDISAMKDFIFLLKNNPDELNLLKNNAAKASADFTYAHADLFPEYHMGN